MNAQQLYSKLVNLRNDAGENIHQRLTLADQLLAMPEWVSAPTGGGGSEARAIDRLEETAFGDLCGALSLPQLLEVLHHLPQREAWKAESYNLRRLYNLMLSKRRKPKARATHDYEGGGDVRFGHKAEADDEMTRLRAENRSLHARLTELTRENRRLRRVVKKISAAMKGTAAGAEAA